MFVSNGMVSVGGGELYYEVGGEGRAVVLLHDGLLDRRAWDGRFETFSRFYHTVRYDRRGYGASSRPYRSFSDVSDLHLLLRHLEIDEACLVGVSSGGKVSLEFALEHPEMVRALVLVGSDLGGYQPSEEKKRRVTAILAVARERGVHAGVDAWMEDPYYPPAREKASARDKVRHLMAENLPRLLSVPSLRTESDPPVIEKLTSIVAPTLILVGEGDDRDNLRISSILEEGLPHATKRVLGASRHLVNLESPEVFERLVLYWLSDLSSPPPSNTAGV